ncbi:MAG: hypothetical protein IJI05_04015 [Erysipelotrichaceae bacterium]|nr:hypothetical protein [Erysipelotrichaceae bacterium]
MEKRKKLSKTARFLLLDLSVALLVSLTGFDEEPELAIPLLIGTLVIAVVLLTVFYKNGKIDDVVLSHSFIIMTLSTISGILSYGSELFALLALISWILCVMNPYWIREKIDNLLGYFRK